jgi:hypothetical protein
MERAIEETNGRAVLYFSDALSADPRYADVTFWGLNDFEMVGTYELRESGGDWLFRSCQPFINPSVTVLRRDAYLGVGGSENRLARRSDTHLFFKIGTAGPVCAVAGAAAIVTQDDPTSITMTIPPGDETYLNCTVWLYDDLLRNGQFSGAERRILRQRLADGYWDIATHSGIRSPIVAFFNATRALRHDPTLLPKRVGNRIRRRELRFTGRATYASLE